MSTRRSSSSTATSRPTRRAGAGKRARAVRPLVIRRYERGDHAPAFDRTTPFETLAYFGGGSSDGIDGGCRKAWDWAAWDRPSSNRLARWSGWKSSGSEAASSGSQAMLTGAWLRAANDRAPAIWVRTALRV